MIKVDHVIECVFYLVDSPYLYYIGIWPTVHSRQIVLHKFYEQAPFRERMPVVPATLPGQLFYNYGDFDDWIDLIELTIELHLVCTYVQPHCIHSHKLVCSGLRFEARVFFSPLLKKMSTPCHIS